MDIKDSNKLCLDLTTSKISSISPVATKLLKGFILTFNNFRNFNFKFSHKSN